MVTITSGRQSALDQLIAQNEQAMAKKQTGLANDALDKIFKSEEVIQSLATLTSFYLPVEQNGLVSTLWGYFNVEGNSTLKESDVTKAVAALGGSTAGARAIWEKINPERKAEITASDFATANYIVTYAHDNLEKMRDDIRAVQLARGDGGVNTVLGDYERMGGGSVFDAFF